ncbi:transcriptional regulator, LysR family [Stenotrophomonas sp. SKA14]|uniref:LysR family transcriptional regulator n=1 Tax=Stenotrophomonas TaxID=40323 RepID=UPI00018FF2EE|nr:LysR family transcriptional regulator [Stenotrophomonas sp. SKA14]EED40232.1 transcriptional regulator, LysR family [Stenotrophomonas sp. SKA14]
MSAPTAINPALLPQLAWFAHIAHHRSFTKAAEEMGVSRPALSQSLKTLEKQLGVRLLHRTTREMSLTEEGQRLFDAVQPSLSTIDSAVRDLRASHDAPSGLLRINTARLTAKTLIEPHLPEFFALYPELRVELVMDDGLSSIVAEGCDAGIRLGERLAKGMIAVPVTPMLEMVVVASPAYLARHGTPSTPAELAGHECLGYRQTGSGTVYAWEFSTPGQPGHDFEVEPRGRYVTNDDEAMIRAALQGLGVMQHIDLSLQPMLADGRLLRLMPEWSAPFPGFYLYVPSREQMPPRVRALMEFLIEKREGVANALGRTVQAPATGG